MTAKDPVAMIIAIWSQLVTWFTTTINAVETIFWTPETGLTFIGTVSCIAVAFGVALLVANWVRSVIKLS